MTDTDDLIQCEKHGERYATYVCQHLLDGEQKGFNFGFDPDDPYKLYPDAWCDECERLYDEAGGWTDDAMKIADIKMLCSGCYMERREEHWIQDNQILQDLIKSGCEYFEEKQKNFVKKYKIDEHERWDWDQGSGKLIFSHNGKPQVEANFHFVGSFSANSNTWMWAWANKSDSENVKSSSRAVRNLGEKLGLLKLQTGVWTVDEHDGGEMTAIMAKEVGAIGAYKTPGDRHYSYMVITDAKWVNKNKILRFFGR